jgi:hypothetical protein
MICINVAVARYVATVCIPAEQGESSEGERCGLA